MACKSPAAMAKRRAYQREYRRLNHEREVPLLRAWTDQHLEHRHMYMRKRRLARYGLTQEQFSILWQAQDGKCAICHTELRLPKAQKGVGRATGRDIAVVDHKGTKVRGILCSICNVGLGMFCDNVNFLKNAILYLEKQEA